MWYCLDDERWFGWWGIKYQNFGLCCFVFLLHRVRHCLPAGLLPARRHGERAAGFLLFFFANPSLPPWAGLTHGGVEDQETFFLPSSTCTLLILLFPIPTVKIPYPSSISSLLVTRVAR